MIEQLMIFNYQDVEITCDRNVHGKTTNQIKRAAITSGALRDIIWRYK